MPEPTENSVTSEVIITDLGGPLEDIYTLFRNQDADFSMEDTALDEEDPEEDEDDSIEQEIEGKGSLKDLTPPAVLYILEDLFGEDWHTLEAGALLSTMAEQYELQQVDIDTIYALQLLSSDDSFWIQWDVFNWCVQALDGIPANFFAFDVPKTTNVIEAMLTASIALAANGTDAVYSPELLSYIAVVCMEEGRWALPAPLDVVQSRVTDLMIQRDLKVPIQDVLDRVSDLRDNKNPPEDELTEQARSFLFLQEYGRDFLEEARREILAYQKSQQ